MLNQQAILRQLSEYQPFDDVEAAHHAKLSDFVANASNDLQLTSRENPIGHLTASAWVLDPSGDKALLTHHRKLEMWLQLGGHVDDDNELSIAALREAVEESGIEQIKLLNDQIFDIDVHLIPERNKNGVHEPAHYHFDVRYLMKAATTEFAVSEESLNLEWVELDANDPRLAEDSINRMVLKTAGKG